MSIETGSEHTTRAPGERNVSSNGAQDGFSFRSAGARRNLLNFARAINISSLQDEEPGKRILLRKQEVVGLLHREFHSETSRPTDGCSACAVYGNFLNS